MENVSMKAEDSVVYIWWQQQCKYVLEDERTRYMFPAVKISDRSSDGAYSFYLAVVDFLNSVSLQQISLLSKYPRCAAPFGDEVYNWFTKFSNGGSALYNVRVDWQHVTPLCDTE